MSLAAQNGMLNASPGKAASLRCLSRLKRLGCDQGSVMIETALSFMIMMLMILGMMECCMMAYSYSVIEEAARQGMRYATVHGTNSTSCAGPSTGCDATAANVVSTVKTYAQTFAGSMTGLNVTVTYPDSKSTATSRVLVSVTYAYAPLFRYPELTQNLSVSSAGRILY